MKNLTADEIKKLPAGRELDALVAVSVAGWRVDDLTAISPYGSRNSRTAHGDDDWLPYYSTDIAAAWEVVCLSDNQWEIARTANGFQATCLILDRKTKQYHTARVYAETAPLAICRASLLAVMENHD